MYKQFNFKASREFTDRPHMMRKLTDASPRSLGEAEREIQANQEMKHSHFGGLEIVSS